MNSRYNYNFSFIIILLVLLVNSSFSQSNSYKIVIDPGHGGKDPGNRGNGYYEKNIVLNISLEVGKRLENLNHTVVYTRTEDNFVDLFTRAQIANESNADLFISIHCDAHSSNAYGAGTFVLGLHANDRNFQIAKKENSVIFLEENYEQKYDGFDPNNPESVISLVLMQEEYLDQSILAANQIQKSFVNNLNRKDRNVKQAGFIVLKYTYMPSVLIETGFLTNKKEGQFLNSIKGQSEMAQAIADAIDKYFSMLDRKISENTSKINNSNSKDIFEFKVRISTSSKIVALKSYNFKGLNRLSIRKNADLYKYYFSNSNNFKDAKKNLNKAISVGFNDAFIELFKNNKPYDINKYLSEIEK